MPVRPVFAPFKPKNLANSFISARKSNPDLHPDQSLLLTFTPSPALYCVHIIHSEVVFERQNGSACVWNLCDPLFYSLFVEGSCLKALFILFFSSLIFSHGVFLALECLVYFKSKCCIFEPQLIYDVCPSRSTMSSRCEET